MSTKFYDARHLISIKPLDKPMLLRVSDRPHVYIDAGMQERLDDLSHIQERYAGLPSGPLSRVRQLIAYRGRNPIIKLAARTASFAFKVDLWLSGRGRAHEALGNGLLFAILTGRLRRSLNKAGRSVEYGSGIGYDSENDDLAIARRYKAWVEAGQHFDTEEKRIGTWFHFAIESTSEFLSKNPHLDTLINFGACYGLVESRLAKRHPGVAFYGIDRAKAIKAFNDAEFRSPNLHFVAADIQDFIAGRDLSKSAFMFMRTAMLFPEPFMVDLFSRLKAGNIAAVIGIEPYGYSFTERRMYQFTRDYQPSIHFRKGGVVHNYPHLALTAGLDLVQEKWMLPYEHRGDETDTKMTYCFIASRL